MVTNDSNFKLDQAINYFKKGEFHKALSIFEILKKNHNDFLLHWYLGHTYFKLHKYSAAIKSVKKSIQLKSKDTLNLNFLGEIYSTISKYDLAIKTFNETLSLDKNNKVALLNLAKINLNIGKIKESENFYKSVLENDPENLRYIYSLSRINNNYPSQEILNLLDKGNLSLIDTIYLKLILAKKFEIKKDYKNEIENLLEAHQIYLSNKKKALNQQFKLHIKLLPRLMSQLGNLKINSFKDLKPIFITGLPRSGTSLVEKIIVSGEKSIQSLGESDVFDKVFFSNQIIKNQENVLKSDFSFLIEKILNQYKEQGLNNLNDIFTDKSITSFLYYELISKIFPNAKFIYCARNPLANIIGIFRSFLPNVYWSHSLEKIFLMSELYSNKIENLKKNKLNNIFIVNLEDLTNNSISVSKNLYKFLDLKWSEKCLENENKNLIIKTASNLQVRNKIKKHDLGYIKSYSKFLKELGFKNKLLV